MTDERDADGKLVPYGRASPRAHGSGCASEDPTSLVFVKAIQRGMSLVANGFVSQLVDDVS